MTVATMSPDRLKKVLKVALPLAFWLAAWQLIAMAVGLEMLLPTDDRPLSSSPEAIEKRYSERYAIYLRSADARIDASVNAEGVAEAVLGEFTK